MPSVETPPGVFRISIRGFLVFFTLSVCLVAGQTPKYLLQGQTVSFVTDIREPPKEILWKHDGNKVVEFDGSEQTAFGSYEHRVTLDWHSADLTISNLRYEDSGLYELETYINKKLDRKQYQLEVIDKVAKPEISCKIINATSPDKSGSQATLTCSSKSHDPQSLLTFQWSSETNSHHEPEIIISLGDVNDDNIYNCTVSNPLSKESAVFQAKDCYPESNTGKMAGIIIGSLFIILIIIVGLVFWIRTKKDGTKPDVENHPPHEALSDSEEKKHLLQKNQGTEKYMDEEGSGRVARLSKKFTGPNEAAPRAIAPKVNKEQNLDDPENSGRPNDKVTAVSVDQSHEENMDEEQSCRVAKLREKFTGPNEAAPEGSAQQVNQEQNLDDPENSGKPNDKVVSADQSHEENMDEEQSCRVAKLREKFTGPNAAAPEGSAQQVNQEQNLDDPKNSGKPNDKIVSADQNKEVKEEENHGTTSASESDDDESTKVGKTLKND